MQPIHSQQSMIEKYQMFNIHNLVALKHIIIFIVQLIDTDRIDINPLSGKSGLRIHCKVATDKLIKKSKECKKKIRHSIITRQIIHNVCGTCQLNLSSANQ